MADPVAARMPPRMSVQVLSVGAGLGILGLASFLYLVVTGRQLGPAAVAPLTTLWVLINAAGPGLFLPLEQEVGRAVAARRALRIGTRPVVVRAALLGLGLFAVLAVLCLALGAPLSASVFADQPLLVVALVLGSGGLFAEHLSRGVLAGNGQFLRYGVQLGVDGVLRIGGAVTLALLGGMKAGPYGVLLGAAPLVAVLLTVPRPGRLTDPGPPAQWRDVGSALGLLVAGSVCAQFVINAAPVAAGLLARPGEAARVGVFISVLVFARVPLFVFAAVQAVLLPGLARLAALGERAAFTARLRRILLIVLALGLAGLAVVLAIGPWLVQLLFGSEFRTTREVLFPLSAAGAAYMVALVLSQALISLRRYRASLAGWAAGSAVFLAALLVPLQLELRAGYALLSATVACVLVLGLGVRRAGANGDVAAPV